MARLAGRVIILVLLLIPRPASATANDCPYAAKRPPIRQVLSMPPSERPRLCGADLSGTDLARASLAGIILSGANLTDAQLQDADLTGANLHDANLTRAYLPNANLAGAFLQGTNLTDAELVGANLARAIITGTILTRANLYFATLTSARFEPEPTSVSASIGIEFAFDLSSLTFDYSPAALVVLRERFSKSGFRSQEREVTFAKLKSQQIQQWKDGPFPKKLEAGFSYLAFDLTCAYGLDYGRPLILLAAMIVLLGLLYAVAIPLGVRGRAAIWRVWQPDRIRKDEGLPGFERLLFARRKWPGGPARPWWFRVFRILALGLLFSLLSAFQFGWRDLNVGNWIARIQPREYTLRATGWIRVVSGLQSLVSVYLLALWALTYFGRPFE